MEDPERHNHDPVQPSKNKNKYISKNKVQDTRRKEQMAIKMLTHEWTGTGSGNPRLPRQTHTPCSDCQASLSATC